MASDGSQKRGVLKPSARKPRSTKTSSKMSRKYGIYRETKDGNLELVKKLVAATPNKALHVAALADDKLTGEFVVIAETSKVKLPVTSEVKRHVKVG